MVTTAPRAERFIALDSLRGLAAVAVLFYHMGDFGVLAGLGVLRNGWLLVDFFFVLSGFVIAASYGERLAGGFSRLRFLWLRLGRVVPLHLAVVALFLAAEFLVFRPWLHVSHELSDLWSGLFLLDGFGTKPGNFYAPVSWSISVELMLYVGAALLFTAGRWGAALAAVVAGAAAVALALEWNEPGFGYLLQRGALGFAIGGGVHFAHRHLKHALPAGVLSLAELALLAAALALVAYPPWGRHASVLPADLLFGLAVLVFARDGGIVSRALQTRPLVTLGQLSYSIYMIHMVLIVALNRGLPPLFTALGWEELVAARPRTFGLLSVELGPFAETLVTLGVAAAVVALSAVTFRWIEEPARQWSRNVRWPRTDAFQPGAGALSAGA